jgi:hypothetical protein
MLNCDIPKDCRACNRASAKRAWCSKYSKWIDGREKVKYPSLIKQAGSFGKAVVQQVAAGMPQRSKDEIARIMVICQACDHFVKGVERCRKCACYMKTKVPWATQHCRLNKW